MTKYSLTTWLCLIGVVPNVAQSGPLEDLQPGHWYEANSGLSDCSSATKPYLDCVTPGLGAGFGETINIMLAWGGGAYDTVNDRLLIWGGGHGDYAGNELYAFDITLLSWTRLSEPSVAIAAEGSGGFSSCNEVYGDDAPGDGQPAARHTYSSLEFVPPFNAALPGGGIFWNQGGSLWCNNGSPSRATWHFDLSAVLWHRSSDLPNSAAGHLGSLGVYDPATEKIYNQTLHAFYEYDPLTETYVVVGQHDSGWWEDRMSAAIDPNNRLFVAVGQGWLRIWDLTDFSFAEYQAGAIAGDDVVIGSDAPGFQYDPVVGTFIAWAGGSDVYTFDASALSFTKVSAAATNTVIPPTPITGSSGYTSKGTYGKFRYIPSKNLYVMVHRTDENVFFYRYSPSVPDNLAPAPPSTLTIL